MVIDLDVRRLNQLPPWVRLLSVDPLEKKEFIYVDPAAFQLFNSDERYRSSQRASPYDFLNSVEKLQNLKKLYPLMTPLPPVSVPRFVNGGFVNGGGATGGTAPKASKTAAPSPYLLDPSFIDRIGEFLDTKYSGKPRKIFPYPQDGISIRRKVVGMRDEVLKEIAKPRPFAGEVAASWF